MSYENTEVPVSRSQEGIRRLIMSRKGGRVAFISDPPQEGFTAIVEIDSQPYQIKLMGLVKDSPQEKTRKYQGRTVGSKETTDRERRNSVSQRSGVSGAFCFIILKAFLRRQIQE